MKKLTLTLASIILLLAPIVSQAQGFYAVSRPTIMVPARGVFFGSILARPQRAQVAQTQAWVKNSAKTGDTSKWAAIREKQSTKQETLKLIAMLWPRVRRGDVQAMYQLAKVYEEGNPLPPQPAMSQKLMMMAAQRGHIEAKNELKNKLRVVSSFEELANKK